MALVLRVLDPDSPTPDADPAAAAPASGDSLTFDSPRVVLGRGSSADMNLPDPTISPRHASIRQRGADYLLVDEGSKNGTFIGNVRLAPQAPRVLQHGDAFRVGAVWLRASIEVATHTSRPGDARALALCMIAERMEEAGDEGYPRLIGPDGVKTRVEPGSAVIIGRGSDSGLVLKDPAISRRVCEVRWEKDKMRVRRLSDKTPIAIGGTPVDKEATLAHGDLLDVGESTIEVRFEALEALAELELEPHRTPAPGEVRELKSPEPAAPIVEAPAESPAEPTPEAPKVVTRRPRSTARASDEEGTRWGFADMCVLLFAFSVLGASFFGLYFLFGQAAAGS